MPFSTKAELKTALGSWMRRSSISTTADDVVTLAESWLNRELGEVLTDQALTGTLDSREISVSAYSVARPIGLFIAETGMPERRIRMAQNGVDARFVNSDYPGAWSYQRSSEKIIFDCPLSQAFPFRFNFRQRFTLAEDGDSNWLLASHPDVYLAACLVWGGLFTKDDPLVSTYASILDGAIPSLNSYISAQNGAELTIDPSLVAIGSGGHFDITTG